MQLNADRTERLDAEASSVDCEYVQLDMVVGAFLVN